LFAFYCCTRGFLFLCIVYAALEIFIWQGHSDQ
jgi:hypothetical protein